MNTTHLHTCMLCEAACGVVAHVEDGRMARIVGDVRDPLSHGHICPKAAALDDIRTDPDRVLSPLVRGPSGFVVATWESALAEASERIARIQNEHGKDAVALYLGNPVAHTYSGLLYALLLGEALGTRSRFSATSLDQLPQMLAGLEMFGHQANLPVPDVDRTDFLLILGGNPIVSNGSLMTAPGIAERLKKVRARGGKVVVVDPRRTETAKVADAHHFIRPGTDALLLMAMLRTLFDEERIDLGRLAAFTDGLESLKRACLRFRVDDVARATGIEGDAIRDLARSFAAAPRAACYGRLGMCTQEHGGVAAWLVLALNIVTGNLDREGGVMFTSPAADVVPFLSTLGQRGHFGKWKSRVRGLPEFAGELPSAVLAEEIETPGAGQIRGLITFAGNPVLSTPNGARLDAAMKTLDCVVSIDLYKNETTRHAHVLLPSTFGLERDHYDLAFHALAVRNTARYAEAVFAPRGETRHDWQILGDLAVGIASRRTGLASWAMSGALRALRRLGPRRMLDMMLRTGPYRLSVHALLSEPHGVDLGALVPRLPGRLYTKRRRIALAPQLYLRQLTRLEQRLAVETARDGLVLIGRRQLRSNNSWMHNSHRLVKGRERCTLLMHPEDAAARSLRDAQRVRIHSRVGAIEVTLEVSDEVDKGVVSLPHGWGHDREGVDLSVARAHAGASLNDLSDDMRVDALTGTATFSGLRVEVSPVVAAAE